MRRLRDKLEEGIIQQIPGTRVNGDKKCRIPNTTNITFGGVDRGNLLKALEEHEIYVTSCAACATGIAPSHVLLSMSLTPGDASSSIRFGLSRYNTEGEIDYLVSVLKMTVKHLKAGRDPTASVLSR